MIIGYSLYGQDNDSYMLSDPRHPDASTCTQCGFLADFDSYHNPFYKIKMKTYDFSHPYDIGNIISLKLKEFLIREKYSGLTIKEFEREPNFYQVFFHNIVEVDIKRSEPTMSDFCPICRNYREVIEYEYFLKDIKNELPDGFYRTDLLFGSGNSKNAMIIVAPITAGKLKREKFKGLYLGPIHS